MKAMRIILAAPLLALSLLLGGCPTNPVLPVDTTLSDTAQAAQKAVNEANVTLTAAYNVVAQNVKEGIWTKEEGKSYVDRLNAYVDKVDAAAALIRTDPLSAKNQAELLSKGIVALHREIAAQARKAGTQ